MTPRLSCVIVDDEYLAVKVIEQHAAAISFLAVDKSFTDPRQALDHLQSHKVDLLFLDIQMPHLNGFELLQQLPKPPLVIFTTARHDYAVEAFALDVLDYLVKPVSPERFLQAVTKANEYRAYRDFKDRREVAGYAMIRSGHKIHKVLHHEISCIEGLSEYFKVFTGDMMLVVHGTLKEFAGELPSSRFMRVHKSFIVSRDHIASFNSRSILLTNKRSIPVGRIYRAAFMRWMQGGAADVAAQKIPE